MGLATLRVDGFVSVNSGADGGTLTTRPFLFLGDALVLNADAKGGEIVVEALDSEGQPIKGFGRDEAIPVTSDSVRHSLRWKEQKDLHQLQGRPMRLRFHMRAARIFSFTPRTLHRHYVRAYE